MSGRLGSIKPKEFIRKILLTMECVGRSEDGEIYLGGCEPQSFYWDEKYNLYCLSRCCAGGSLCVPENLDGNYFH